MRERLKKSDCEQYVLRRARELAESGRFSGVPGIEFELRYVEGFEPAPNWLSYAPLREELDIICQRAKTRSSLPASQDVRVRPKGYGHAA